MRFSRSMVVLLVLVVALAAIVPAAAQDGEGTVVILLDGESYDGVFEGNSTAQLFGFNGSAGDVVTITMTQEEDSPLDPFIVLLGERGEVLASNDDDDDAEILYASAIEDVELPYDGSYFIMATSFLYIDNILDESNTGLTEGQNYVLTLDGITAPTGLEGFDENVVTLYNSEVSVGTDAGAETTSAEPVYYLKLVGSAGDVVNIEAASDDFNTILHVFDPEGVRIAANNDADDGINSVIEGLELPVDGEYLIFVTDVFFYDAMDEDFAGVGEFQITIS